MSALRRNFGEVRRPSPMRLKYVTKPTLSRLISDLWGIEDQLPDFAHLLREKLVSSDVQMKIASSAHAAIAHRRASMLAHVGKR